MFLVKPPHHRLSPLTLPALFPVNVIVIVVKLQNIPSYTNFFMEAPQVSSLFWAQIFYFSQGYVVCPSDKRFMLLFTFVKKNKDKKCMVFFSTCSSVKYHAELFNYIDIPVKDIHVSRINLFNLKFLMLLLRLILNSELWKPDGTSLGVFRRWIFNVSRVGGLSLFEWTYLTLNMTL